MNLRTIAFLTLSIIVISTMSLIVYQEYYFSKLEVSLMDSSNQSAKKDISIKNSIESIDRAKLDTIDHLKRAAIVNQEIFNYISIKLNSSISHKLRDEIFTKISDMKSVAQLQISNAIKSSKFDEFKHEKLTKISQKIQSKINSLQNVSISTCKSDTFPRIICILHSSAFASTMHEILWCFVRAFYSNKTVILDLNKWTRYIGSETSESKLKGKNKLAAWSEIFEPISSCTRDIIKLTQEEKLEIEEHNKLTMTQIYHRNRVQKRMIMNYLPREYGETLIKLLDEPNAWFHGLFIGYIMRKSPSLIAYLDQIKDDIGFSNPIVGVHVRRSDKLKKEALFYPLSDYMLHVEDFYAKLDLINSGPIDEIEIHKRSVYVASDDPSVITDLRTHYPKYNFIGSQQIAKLASKHSTRYSNDSLYGVLTDIFLLSETDFIVCTLSSAVCRLSYELMHFNSGDATQKIKSLDVPFHYQHSLTPQKIALFNHVPTSPDEVNLRIGDSIYEGIRDDNLSDWRTQAVDGHAWDGYFYGSKKQNLNQKKHLKSYQLYPNYKMGFNITLI